jgi:HD-like signal output (HDOD) protein
MLTTASLPNELALANARSRTMLELAKLPVFHGAALKLLSVSLDASSAMDEFEEVFKSDPAISAELLLVVNSAAFGARCRIASVRHAITFLGLKRVRDLANTVAFCFYVRNVPRTECVRRLWSHSIATAVAAEALATLFGLPDAYAGGLMHDLGRLSLLRVLGTPYEETISVESPSIEAANEVEKGLFGLTHCEAGENVARRWRLPRSLMVCMAQHHAPLAVSRPGNHLHLTQLACRLADAFGFPELPKKDCAAEPPIECLVSHPGFDPDNLLEKIGERIATLDV